MTEYWVSQGNKWCDFCKIYIANNAASIRTHESGQRHKENVAKRLNDIRKENASKEKERQQALKDMDRIEAQANRSYQKDLAAQERLESATTATKAAEVSNTCLPSKSSGVDMSSNGLHAGSHTPSTKGGRPPGPVLKEARPLMPIRGKASSLDVGKRKRPAKPESVSKEEADALKAREAAKKRVQEREKGFLGLYQSL